MSDIACGSQCTICDLPIRIDSYEGCSHACEYCFAKRKGSIAHVRPVTSAPKAIRRFAAGERSGETDWCDFRIPLHWGGMSDPFQPAEERFRVSRKCLDAFVETHYPFVFSTKGIIATTPEYLARMKQCDCVAQVSMLCSSYDRLEQGAPNYEARLRMCEALAKNTRRVIARLQPYVPNVFTEVLGNIRRLADVGVYGVVIEGMKYVYKPAPPIKTVQVGGDHCFEESLLRYHFAQIRNECHKHGMRFFCGENRLRSMGDDLTCCGIEGLGYEVNKFNLSHLMNGDPQQPTERMRQIGSARCFKTLAQNACSGKYIGRVSFYEMMCLHYKRAKANAQKAKNDSNRNAQASARKRSTAIQIRGSEAPSGR